MTVTLALGRFGMAGEAIRFGPASKVVPAYRLRPTLAHEGRRLRLGRSDARAARSLCAQRLYVSCSAHQVIERCASLQVVAGPLAEDLPGDAVNVQGLARERFSVGVPHLTVAETVAFPIGRQNAPLKEQSEELISGFPRFSCTGFPVSCGLNVHSAPGRDEIDGNAITQVFKGFQATPPQ
jgi:hypothetical protein